MKLRHNKKRNTAFLYETLVKELTKNVVNDNDSKKKHILSILKEHFKKDSLLGKELQLYKDVLESRGLDYDAAERILYEAKTVYARGFKNQQVYDEQSEVISKVNKELTKSVFSNFVPNYKDLATLSQIFNDELTVKKRVMLERQIIKDMTSKEEVVKEKMKPIDKLTFKTFISKFNDAYSDLIKEQRDLLTQYIYSFADNGVGLKVYLNEEIGRLKEKLEQSLTMEEISADLSMVESTKKVLSLIDGYKKENINEEVLERILRIQKLVEEIESDG